MGVNFFSKDSPDEFGVFDQAFVSLFRLTAGETWVDSISRLKDDGSVNYGPFAFIFTYVVLVVWVLLQVSVAVLLDNFVSHTMKADDEKKLALQMEAKSNEATNVLEPVLKKLLRGYTDEEDLTAKIDALFQVSTRTYTR